MSNKSLIEKLEALANYGELQAGIEEAIKIIRHTPAPDVIAVSNAIYNAARGNGDDLKSPMDCAKAAIEALGEAAPYGVLSREEDRPKPCPSPTISSEIRCNGKFLFDVIGEHLKYAAKYDFDPSFNDQIRDLIKEITPFLATREPVSRREARLAAAFEDAISAMEACAIVYKHGELDSDAKRARKALAQYRSEYRNNE